MGLTDGGQRDRRHVVGTRRADVLAQARALEEQRGAGAVPSSGSGLAVQRWLTQWLDTIASRRISPRTSTGYRSCLARTIGGPRAPPARPTAARAPGGRLHRLSAADGLAPATIAVHHRVLSPAPKAERQRGRLTGNVATLIDAPSVTHDEAQPLTAGEARQLLGAARDLRNGARWSVALARGLRQGEALGLLQDAGDLEAGTLTVGRPCSGGRVRG